MESKTNQIQGPLWLLHQVDNTSFFFVTGMDLFPICFYIKIYFTGSPTSESSRSSSSISPSEGNEILSGSKSLLSNKNFKMMDSSGLNLLTNKSSSQISLLGSNSSITNKSPSQISLLGSNSSINSLARSIPDSKTYSSGSIYQPNSRKSPLLDRSKSPYGSPNLSDRSKSPYFQTATKTSYGSPILEKSKNYSQNLERSKSPMDKAMKNLYSSPGLTTSRDLTKSPLLKNGEYSSVTLDRYGSNKTGHVDSEHKNELNLDRMSGLPLSMTSSQIYDSNQSGDKPLFSTLPRQRSIPTIIGMPRRLSEQRKSLPQVPTDKIKDYMDGKTVDSESKNPFEKLEGFTISANPTGKNPFLDENEEQYNYETVSSRVSCFEQKGGNGNDKIDNSTKMNPYVGIHTAQNAMYQTSIGQYGTVMTTSIPPSQNQSTTRSMTCLQYSVPVSSGHVHSSLKKPSSTIENQGNQNNLQFHSQNQSYKPTMVPPTPATRRDPMKYSEKSRDSSKLGLDPIKTKTTLHHDEPLETPTPSSSTGTDSSRKEIGQEGDVESDADETEMAEQGDMVPELGKKIHH